MKNRRECLREYGSDYGIQQKVDAGELFRVGKAVYSEDSRSCFQISQCGCYHA